MFRMSIALVLSMMVGFISLCQELLWFRTITFATGSSPSAFSYVLGFFLIGVALGSLQAQFVLKQKKLDPYVYISLMLGIAALVYFTSIPLIAHFYAMMDTQALIIALLLVALVSYFMGGVFPVLCHIGAQDNDAVGISVSWIYLANILGATAGPLITGFWLMDIFTLEQLTLMTCFATMILAILIFIFTPQAPHKSVAVLLSAICLIGMVLFHQPLFDQTIARLHWKKKFNPKLRYRHILQNHSGILTVKPGWRGKDYMYGHGMYDGRFNVDPVSNVNGITRCYHIANMHPNPKDVLMIGMGSGSWARVVANYRKVKRFTIVEINPDYPRLIKRYPDIASVLKDKRTKFVPDDGRRWLIRNPKAKFDFIVMNTTFHWRSNITNLISIEFFKLAKAHLNPGGVIYLNTTSNYDIHHTLTHAFKYVTRYSNFAAGSDHPFNLSYKKRVENLTSFYHKGRQTIRKRSRVLYKMARFRMRNHAPYYRRNRHKYWKITDDNMSTEFKHNNYRKWRLNKRISWSALWRKLQKNK